MESIKAPCLDQSMQGAFEWLRSNSGRVSGFGLGSHGFALRYFGKGSGRV